MTDTISWTGPSNIVEDSTPAPLIPPGFLLIGEVLVDADAVESIEANFGGWTLVTLRSGRTLSEQTPRDVIAKRVTNAKAPDPLPALIEEFARANSSHVSDAGRTHTGTRQECVSMDCGPEGVSE